MSLRPMLLASTLIAAGAGAAQAFTLNVLHFNDFHSRIESVNKYDSTCSAEEEGKGECFGGAARLKTEIDASRAAAKAKGDNATADGLMAEVAALKVRLPELEAESTTAEAALFAAAILLAMGLARRQRGRDQRLAVSVTEAT